MEAEAPPELSRLVSYEEVVGGEEEENAPASRNADLLVMARPNNLDGHDAFHAAMFLSGSRSCLRPPIGSLRSVATLNGMS